MKADDQQCMCGIFFVFTFSLHLAEPFTAADDWWIFMLLLVERVVPDGRLGSGAWNVLCWSWRRRLRDESWWAVCLRNIDLHLGILLEYRRIAGDRVRVTRRHWRSKYHSLVIKISVEL